VPCLCSCLKKPSRNAYNNDRCDIVFAKNYYQHFKLRLPHPDTIDEVLRSLCSEQLETLMAHLVRKLFEQKLLRKFRFLRKYYMVAVDVTGTHTFDHKHCEHCLTKTSKNDITTWFHYVLEAKLVTSSGFAISLATEFIENISGQDFEKQELKHFKYALNAVVETIHSRNWSQLEKTKKEIHNKKQIVLC